MTKGFILITCLSVFMIASCDTPTKIDKLELKNQSSTDNKTPTNLNDIALIYRYKCSICHGKQGVSVIDGAPDLISSDLNLDERVAIIINGRGTMPPQKDVLDMPTIRGLAIFIDSFK